jgi:hypothetical protein
MAHEFEGRCAELCPMLCLVEVAGLVACGLTNLAVEHRFAVEFDVDGPSESVNHW